MATTEKRLTKAEIRKAHQAACRQVACLRPGLCPYCPNTKDQANG